MKLKVRYLSGGEADEWTSADSQTLRRWDVIALALAGMISLSALIAYRTAPPDLASHAPGGFVLWFLTCCAYPMLGIVGVVNWIFGTQDGALMRFLTVEHPVFGLWILDFVTVLAVWGIGRLCALRRETVPSLRIAGNFLLILIGWGVFQMMLFGIASVREFGGFPAKERPAAQAPAAESPAQR